MAEEIFALHDERNERLEKLERQLKGLRVLVALFALLNVSGFARYLFYDGYLEIIGYGNALWMSVVPLLRLFLVWWSLKHPLRSFIALFLSWSYYIIKSIVTTLMDYYDQFEPMAGRTALMLGADVGFLVFVGVVCYKAWQFERLKKVLPHAGAI